jgi:hypothetical protein
MFRDGCRFPVAAVADKTKPQFAPARKQIKDRKILEICHVNERFFY